MRHGPFPRFVLARFAPTSDQRWKLAAPHHTRTFSSRPPVLHCWTFLERRVPKSEPECSAPAIEKSRRDLEGDHNPASSLPDSTRQTTCCRLLSLAHIAPRLFINLLLMTARCAQVCHCR